MPGPFPGMDPYFEDPLRWPGVHSELISSARAALNRALPDGFAADAGERLYVVESDRDIYPDVVIGRERPPSIGEGGRSAVATAPWVITAPPDEVREPYIEIISLSPPRSVVTVIEVLSPTNKTKNTEGERLYRQKQRELIGSEVNLIEIDFLRGGSHTVAAPLSRLQRRGRWNYLVCLHRPIRRWEFKVWHSLLKEPLPVITVPLGQGDEQVALDLQGVVNRAYDDGGYDRMLNYTQSPPGPLTEDERDWIAEILASRNKSSNGTNE